jgi:hypothetical protein
VGGDGVVVDDRMIWETKKGERKERSREGKGKKKAKCDRGRKNWGFWESGVVLCFG